MKFCYLLCSFVEHVELFCVKPRVFDRIEKVDVFEKFFLEAKPTWIVWMCRDHETVWVRFSIFTEIVERMDIFCVFCGVDNKNMSARHGFFNARYEENAEFFGVRLNLVIKKETVMMCHRDDVIFFFSSKVEHLLRCVFWMIYWIFAGMNVELDFEGFHEVL